MSGLTRAELDKLHCSSDHSAGNTGGVVLHAKCHPRGTLKALYFADGVLDVHCRQCDEFVARIAIAQADVDRLAPRLTCDKPDCTEPPEKHFVSLGGHPDRKKQPGVAVSYANGKLIIMCAHCSRVVEQIHVREAAS